MARAVLHVAVLLTLRAIIGRSKAAIGRPKIGAAQAAPAVPSPSALG